MRRGLRLVVLLAAMSPAAAQTVSQWRTSSGLPLVVVHLPGGDLEHLAAVVPAGSRPVERAGDAAVQVTLRHQAQILAVRAGELRLAGVLGGLLGAVRETGAAAIVAVGPQPPRELAVLLERAEDVPWRPLPRPPCRSMDGGVDALSGSPPRVELALDLPEATDRRHAAASMLARWIEVAARPRVPGLRGDLDLSTGCPRLVLRAPAERVPARVLLRALRSELAALAQRAPTAAELAAVRVASAAEVGRLAVDAAGVCREVAEWVALGGLPGAVLAPAEADGAAIASLARDVLGAHRGWGTVVEGEFRSPPPERESLENGSLFSVRWVPGDMAVAGLALGGFAPGVGADVLDRCAQAAAGQGWSTHRADLLGVPTVAVAVPAEDAAEALEVVVASLQGAAIAIDDPLWSEVFRSLGLAVHADAETVSLAVALPWDAEEAAEAARKFLGGLGAGEVRVEAPAIARRLQWVAADGPARLVALAELEGSEAGVLAAAILQGRAAGAALEAHVLAPPGRLALALAGGGEAHVPGLDARLAGTWPHLVRPVEGVELAAALARVEAQVLGDMAHAVARAAARPFLPCTLEEAALRAVTAGDVNRVLGSLPGWTGLVRLARGPAPTPDRGVRKSAPGAPAAR